MNDWKWFGLLCWVGWAAGAGAQDAETPSAGKAGPVEVIVVTGASGAPQFAEPFAAAAAQWEQLARDANARLHRIGPAAEEASPADESSADDTSDFERLRSTLEQIEPEGDLPVWIVLIGHGTFAQQTAKFNLVGPDVAAAELARWVEPLQRPLVVINGASASGPFINRLTGPQRIIVTATRSGDEQNYARFGAFFAEAIGNLEADLDHDRTVSVLEAFLAAAAATAAFYAEEGRLATEHPLLDDNGDGRGTSPDFYRGVRVIKAAGEGRVDGDAARWVTLRPRAGVPPLNAAQRAERDRLESELRELREAKAELDPADYFERFLRVALELAELYRQTEQAGDGAAGDGAVDDAESAGRQSS